MEKEPDKHTVSETDTDKVSHFFRREVREKIEQHPCYSKNAHQYARMHLPVAPACNIQCNYCNRKYDCSNESRPGVVSSLVDPNGALKQFRAVTRRTGNLTVVGIAGPGDALANPKATFATLRLIRQENPDVQLCISTNGLALVDHVDELAQLGVHHLTITINCTDPAVGSKIYPWIYFRNRRLRGEEAAGILIERQLEGLRAAAEAGMLVKVNTVLIPGVNDMHVAEVSEKVRGLGAMLHNIMPLISEAEHGTYFGVTGQRGPDEHELNRARAESGQHMAQMTHCQQCRADAVGTLGEACGSAASTSNDNMSENREATLSPAPDIQIAVATAKDGTTARAETVIRTHFGYAEQFEIYRYSVTEQQFVYKETRIVSRYCSGPSECSSDEDYKQLLIESISDCDQVLCSRIGIAPWRELEKQGVTPNVDYAYVTVERALEDIAQKLSREPAALPERLAGGD